MHIAGAGSCIIDSIYMNCSYNNYAFQKMWSKTPGDGGLIKGGLVFSEDVQNFVQKEYQEILSHLTGNRTPDIRNLGGPAVVAMAHAAQILQSRNVKTTFYGAVGTDDYAELIRKSIEKTPLNAVLKEIPDKRSATTDVFDDPTQRNGKGERSFINTIGAAGYYGEDDLPDSFYDADIVLLGGTALVPRLHDGLHKVLAKAKQRGCTTVVGTVYDFRNEKKGPRTRWPLGDQSSYSNIDLLITDEEEAIKLSGQTDVETAAKELISYGLRTLIITRGALDMLIWSSGAIFEKKDITYYPVSAYMDHMMEENPSLRKDTTGCGDNFVGGVIVGLALQILEGRHFSDIRIAPVCAWGAASGGLTCTYHGGTYYEKEKGEKEKLLSPVVTNYLKTIKVK